MNVGIIGTGFTGLSAALELQKKGHKVTLLEKESFPGGLATGFKKAGWNWPLEKHYHHIFTGDTDIQKLADEVNVKFSFSLPNTSWFIDKEIFQIDSPLKLLRFPKLTLSERSRMGAVIGYLKSISNWKPLEKVSAEEWLSRMMGRHTYNLFWKPLLISKFGQNSKKISMAWFWARIKSRSARLGYPEGGFQNLANKTAEKIIDRGGLIHYNTNVIKVVNIPKNKVLVHTSSREHSFDSLIITLPNAPFTKMSPQLPEDYKRKLLDVKGVGAITMIIELKKAFFPSGVYWLSVCEKKYPFIAVVEHTNFVDKSHYNNHHLIYIGNYLSSSHRYFSLSDDDLLNEYEPYLNMLNPHFKDNLIDKMVFKVPFAQPVVTLNFSGKILPFVTPLKNVYLANLQQVYPWDRQTNYAVTLGRRVADIYF
ncbi:MAG: NAD(P)/FAD-dependent oxidoreductase [Candidatus Microgenomates bacterium]